MTHPPLSAAIAAELDIEQADAIRSFGPHTLVIAGAGSGKTRVLTYGLAHLLDDCGHAPEQIILLTFTRKAAETMRERASDVTGTDLTALRCGTFHAVGALLLREAGHEFSIIDESESVTMIAQLGAELFQDREIHGFKQLDPERLQGFFSQSREEDMELAEILWTAPEYYRDSRRLIEELHERFRERKHAEGLYDYADLLYETRGLLQGPAGGAFREHVRAVLVDEVQDLNRMQRDIVTALTVDGAWRIEVGDAEQCQPPDALIETTGEAVPIAELDPKTHRLPSFDLDDGVIAGRDNGYGFTMKQRAYSGALLTLTAEGHSSRCTPGHRWPIKWASAAADAHAIYLMRERTRWRVGACKLQLGGSGQVHLRQCVRREKAESTYVLATTMDSREADALASLVAAKYGLPTTPFQATDSYSVELIDMVYAGLDADDQDEHARTCLSDYGRDPRYPFLTESEPYATQGKQRQPVFHAANLLAEVMLVAVADSEPQWVPVRVTSEFYTGVVHSLAVEPHQTYLADGLITHNSIYGWRGASYESLQELAEQPIVISKLETNYRSTAEIVDLSKSLIPPTKLALDIRSDRGASGISPQLLRPRDESEEAAAALNWVTQHHGEYEELCLLARAHDHLKGAYTALMTAGIPVALLGRRRGPFEDARQYLMQLMRLADNPRDRSVWQRLLPTFGFDTEEQYARLVTLREHADPLGTCASWAYGSPVADVLQALQGVPSSSWLWNSLCYGPFGVLLSMSMDDPQRAAGLISDLAEVGQRPGEGAAYLNALVLGDSDEQVRSGVRMGTVHAAKGLEWPHVLVLRCSYEAFPSRMAVIEERDAEERRVFYVAVTRAEDTLTIAEAPWLSGGRHHADFLADRNINEHFQLVSS